VASARQIIQAVDAIAAFYKPLKIILFGSYAYGTPTYDSDVDLLVLKNFRVSEHDEYMKIRTAVEFPFPLDLLVRRPDVVRQRIAWHDCFLKEITGKGLLVYASHDKRMGDQGRRRLRRHLAAFEIAKENPLRSDLFPLSTVH
jgi:predicted nucleotidyltransferase